MQHIGQYLERNGHTPYYGVHTLPHENAKGSSDKLYEVNSLIHLGISLIKKVEGKTGTPSFSGGLVRDNPSLFFMKRLGVNLRRFLPLNDPITQKEFRFLLEKIKPDILHGHNIITFSMAPFIQAKEYGIPTVITVHGYWPACPLATFVRLSDQKPCYAKNWEACTKHCASSLAAIPQHMRRLQKLIVKYVDRIITVSHYGKKRLVDFGYPKEQITVIHNGVDLKKFEPADSSNSDAPYLLHVGRLSYYKGTHILFKVAEQLNEDYPNLKIKIAGRQVDSELENIEPLGWIPDQRLVKLYSSALTVIVPSVRPEPFPLVPLEAMACGTPVIASRIGGLQESIKNGKTGFLVPPGNPTQVTKKVVRLYENPELREQMGKRAREHVEKHFSLQKMGKRYTETYKELLE